MGGLKLKTCNRLSCVLRDSALHRGPSPGSPGPSDDSAPHAVLLTITTETHAKKKKKDPPLPL